MKNITAFVWIVSHLALADSLAPRDESRLSETLQVPYRSSFTFRLESAAVWQTRNEFRIPGSGGTGVNLSDYKAGPYFGVRLYGEWSIDEHHGLRVLVAPLSLGVSYSPTQATSIKGTTFPAGSALTTNYKFNSYRLTYRYLFDSRGPFSWRVGLTAKIRDANITTTDGTQSVEDPNLGFVPLIYLGGRWTPSAQWFVDLDIDALAAPQGRAEDLALRLGHLMGPWEVSLGYRLLEGGADNSTVFTFAFFHYLFASVAISF